MDSVISLSRRKHGFDSRRARQQNQLLSCSPEPSVERVRNIRHYDGGSAGRTA